MNRLPALTLVVASATVSAAESVEDIPERFLGWWAQTEAECQLGRLAISRLTIEPNRITFYESIGEVLSAAIEGQTDLAVLLDSRGEGFTWVSALQFRLSADEQSLTDMTGGRLGVVRIRCESNA